MRSIAAAATALLAWMAWRAPLVASIDITSRSGVSPATLLQKKLKQQQAQASILQAVGRPASAAAVLRHVDEELVNSPFDIELHCQAATTCPSVVDADAEGDLHADARNQFCFCYMRADARCYVGECDPDPFDDGELFSLVSKRGMCKFLRKPENIVDLENCGSAPHDLETQSDSAVYERLRKDPKKMTSLRTGTALRRPDAPAVGSFKYPMNVQDTVDLLAQRAKQLRDWNMENVVIAAHKIKTDMQIAAKKQM